MYFLVLLFHILRFFLQLQRNSTVYIHTLGIRLLTSNVVKFRLSKSKINKNYLHSIPMGSIFTIKNRILFSRRIQQFLKNVCKIFRSTIGGHCHLQPLMLIFILNLFVPRVQEGCSPSGIFTLLYVQYLAGFDSNPSCCDCRCAISELHTSLMSFTHP